MQNELEYTQNHVCFTWNEKQLWEEYICVGGGGIYWERDDIVYMYIYKAQSI